LKRFEIVLLDGIISEQALKLLQDYRLSHGLAIPDALIAATALVLNHHFITKNQRDYRFIKRLKLLPYPLASGL
jgi:predicted nucleic acid-binding protein